MQFIIKTIISALIIASIATISKKAPSIGAIIASLPLTSILAMIWLYQDTKDVTKVSSLSTSICWIVLPSIVFFVVLPIFLKRNINFYLALVYSSGIMVLSYSIYSFILEKFGIDI